MKKKLKIIHTTCHTNWGGLEKRIFNESCWMEDRGHSITIVAPENTPLAKRAIKKKLSYYPVSFRNGTVIRDFLFLKKLYNEIRPDILNTHGNMDSKIALSAAIGSGIRFRILSRHISADVRPSFYNRLLYGRLCDFVFTTADVTTNNLRADLRLPPEKVLTVSSGVIPDGSLPDRERARHDLASELSLEDGTRFIGFAGRVSSDKGVDHILEAFLKVALKLQNHHLVIVGGADSDFLKGLENRVKGSNYSERVHFTGFRDNIWPYLLAFDCMVLASSTQFEGISQALLEAMFAKCPVIASNSGGSLEIVLDGETGLLFMRNDSDQIAACMVEMVEKGDRASMMAEKAFRMVSEKHTIDAMGEKILSVYEKFF